MEHGILNGPEIRTVVLVTSWSAAMSRLHRDPMRPDAILRDDASRGLSLAENGRAFARGLERLVAALMDNAKEVVIAAAAPQIGVAIPESLARLARGRGRAPAPTRASYLDRQAAAFEVFASLRDRYGARVIHPHDVLCPGETCVVSAVARPLCADMPTSTARRPGPAPALGRRVLTERLRVGPRTAPSRRGKGSTGPSSLGDRAER